MTTITVTNLINGRSNSIDFNTKAEAAAAILVLNTEYDSSTFEIEIHGSPNDPAAHKSGRCVSPSYYGCPDERH